VHFGRFRLTTALTVTALLGAAALTTPLGRPAGTPVATDLDPVGSSARPAFPGAMGFGAATPGGRGGRVIRVTNLRDSGPGSLRAAVEASGRRTVVFRVAGTITLRDRLTIEDPYLSVLGQTAPGEGITLRTAGDVTDQLMLVETHDVVLRYLRFRPGPDGGNGEDALTVEGSAAHDVIIDHCSLSWAVDEVFSSYDDSHRVTLQNSIVSEGLSRANHEEGEHSKGALAGGYDTHDISILRNLFVSNVDRNPQVSGVSVADVRNNVVHNDGRADGEAATVLSSSKGHPDLNWVNNVYRPGPDSDRSDPEFATTIGTTDRTHSFFARGNVRWTADGWRTARVQRGAIGRRYSAYPVPRTPTLSTSTTWRRVLATAGASRNRDSVDERLVREVRRGGGAIIDHPSEVGGWPRLATGTPYADPDRDGMATGWERRHGSRPGRSDANGDVDRDGWTNLEEFAHARARVVG
jgi:hypothetical protein